MKLVRLDHVTLRCRDLSVSIVFYCDVVGLEIGKRPPFDFEGAWLYLGDQPVIHLISDPSCGPGSGAVDHFAFHGSDLTHARAKLAAAGIHYGESPVPGRPLYQLFLNDPDGTKVEINFAIAADAGR